MFIQRIIEQNLLTSLQFKVLRTELATTVTHLEKEDQLTRSQHLNTEALCYYEARAEGWRRSRPTYFVFF